MKATIISMIFILTVLLSTVSCQGNRQNEYNTDPKTVEVFQSALLDACQKYKRMLETADISQGLPSETDKAGNYKSCSPQDWVSGFFPGSLWYLYEYSGDEFWKDQAIQWTELLKNQQFNTGTHDLGFMIYCSYGNAFRLTGKEDYKQVLIQAAKSLSSRYNENVESILSWNFPGWWNQFAVIIDNMMNLELLTNATKLSGDTLYQYIANKHAETTMKNHFREDFSSYHVVDYDTVTGAAINKGTFQGYSDNSAWARGQAWGLYGFVMMYRETGKNIYLDQAIHIADFIIKNLPAEKVLYWDFNDPDIPETNFDASAMAISASALIELSEYGKEGNIYLQTARDLLLSLSSSDFTTEPGENSNFILKHSVAFKPKNTGVDVSLNYADYYYIEALLRILNISNQAGS